MEAEAVIADNCPPSHVSTCVSRPSVASLPYTRAPANTCKYQPAHLQILHGCPPKELRAIARVHKRQSAQSAERNLARQWPRRA